MPTHLSASNFLGYAILGLIIGVMAVIYTRSIYLFEDWFENLSDNYYIRHTLGMLLVGIIMYLMMRMFGHYYIQGVGYATIQDILDGKLSDIWILFLLAAVKLLAVSLTLGSGASGGVFSPGLFIGATLGAALAMTGNYFYPALGASPVDSAVIGMACMIGASTGAAVTAVVMTLEMTHDYNVVIPLIVAVSLAYATRRYLMAENIYTLKLARRGHHVPTSLQNHLYLMHKALDIVQSPYIILDADARVADLPERSATMRRYPHVILADHEQVRAVISSETFSHMLPGSSADTPLQEFAETCYSRVSENMMVFDVYAQLRSEHSHIALVMDNNATDNDPGGVAGVLSWMDISEAANLPHSMRSIKPHVQD